ncbi:hypothetical protein HYS48_00345 [Candidatus Woesearchaeota archaeon]|nr:hypothetical protein [Candidatus Woesearchaeota archaeon]
METISYPLRIPKQLLELVNLKSRDEYIDKTTALRKLLYEGAEEYALRLVAEGRISAIKAAEFLHLNVHDIYRLAERHGIHIGATEEQERKSRETAKKLFGKAA